MAADSVASPGRPAHGQAGAYHRPPHRIRCAVRAMHLTPCRDREEDRRRRGWSGWIDSSPWFPALAPPLRPRSPGFVRRPRRYYSGIRLLWIVHRRLRFLTFPPRTMRPEGLWSIQRSISRFPRKELPHMPGSQTTLGRRPVGSGGRSSGTSSPVCARLQCHRDRDDAECWVPDPRQWIGPVLFRQLVAAPG